MLLFSRTTDVVNNQKFQMGFATTGAAIRSMAVMADDFPSKRIFSLLHDCAVFMSMFTVWKWSA